MRKRERERANELGISQDHISCAWGPRGLLPQRIMTHSNEHRSMWVSCGNLPLTRDHVWENPLCHVSMIAREGEGDLVSCALISTHKTPMTSFHTAFGKASQLSLSDLEENAQCFLEGRKLETFGHENGAE